MRHAEAAAQRKLCVSDKWLAFKWEAVTGGLIITGGYPIGNYASGPRKGKPKWKMPGTMVVLSDADLEAEKALYVDFTGNCPECLGSKQEFESWTTGKGTTYRPCSKCGATGKATHD